LLAAADFKAAKAHQRRISFLPFHARRQALKISFIFSRKLLRLSYSLPVVICSN
jgi:hypothetical protein